MCQTFRSDSGHRRTMMLYKDTIKLLVYISLTRGSSMFCYLNSCLVSASPVMTLLHVSSFKVLIMSGWWNLRLRHLSVLSVWWPYTPNKKYLVLYQGIKESVLHQHLWTVLYDLLEALFCVHPEGDLFEPRHRHSYEKTHGSFSHDLFYPQLDVFLGFHVQILTI